MASQTFNQAMDDFTSQVALAATVAYDFSGIQRLADIGGGHGVLLGKIRESNPSMLGILFDFKSCDQKRYAAHRERMPGWPL